MYQQCFCCDLENQNPLASINIFCQLYAPGVVDIDSTKFDLSEVLDASNDNASVWMFSGQDLQRGSEEVSYLWNPS